MKISMCVLSIIIILTSCSVENERGVYEDKIEIGMSAAFTGPAKHLGNSMKAGIEAAFENQNRQGGIHGRKLVLKSMDDQYEPDLTAPNMRTLIEENKVFAILGNVGTPTAAAAIPIALETKTPMVGSFTGAGILRQTPPDRYIINYRASYAEETAAIIDGLITEVGLAINEIAFFTQNDSYGDDGFAGGIHALKKHGLKDESEVLHVRYKRNTLDVGSAIAEILNATVSPKAIIMIGSYAPSAKFIKEIKKNKLKTIFASVSFVDSNALLEQLGIIADNVVVTEVVPNYQSALPGVVEYRKHIAEKEQNFVSLEGYLAANILIQGLLASGKGLTIENFIDAVENLDTIDLGIQTKLGFSKTSHQASHSVWPTIIKDNKIVPLENWTTLAK